MTLTFTLAPDSFKESMTAKQVCDAMELGIKHILPDAKVQKVPMLTVAAALNCTPMLYSSYSSKQEPSTI